jgi:double-stranded uracil-DNA glycosylase
MDKLNRTRSACHNEAEAIKVLPSIMAKKSSIRAPICGFPPIAAPNARVLVLGSMPSVASLAKRQYYAHPQNAFWPIMGRLFGAGPEMPYETRKGTLCERGVAVWDVLRECHREGSLDTAICARSERANDFRPFFERHAGINIVFFNGQKAEAAFRRHVLQEVMEARPDLRYVRLPSTSPANAGMTFDEKLAAWRAVANAL